MERERVTREAYESIVADGIANDADAGGPEIDEQGRTRREYVDSYLRDQYEVIDLEKR